MSCLAVTFWSSSSYTISMGFKFTDCVVQDNSWRMCCSSLLLIYLWQSLLVCFRSLSCMSTNPWPQAAFQMGLHDASLCCDSWSDSIYSSSGANTRLYNWQKFPTHSNKVSSMLYNWCYTEGCSSFTNSLLLIDPPIWPKDFALWLICPKDFILLLYCPVLVHLRLLPLFCFLNSGFLTAILP